jgi:hypothetical protein
MSAPRPSSAVRADVRLTNGKGFTRRFGTWDEVRAWLGSPEFIKGTPAISSVRLIHKAAQAGGTGFCGENPVNSQDDAP